MSTACPDADLLVAYGEGRCSPQEAADVQEHVRDCATCTMLLDQLEDRADEEGTENALIDEVSDAVMSLVLEAGESAGRYVIRSVIGEGAMGVVYEAHDPELDRRVALKALKVDPRDSDTREMLTLEGQTLGQLQHPNVVPVFDIGRSHRGWFIAMEFVDGQPLRAWCEGQTWPAILDRFIEAARGLTAAHRVGIIHRDFKPANVLVGLDGRARVADFGIAVNKTVIAAESNTRSSEGDDRADPSKRELIGTPAYMAPEQLEGRAATEHSDQYAFFIALFEMLEGHRPFAGTSVRAQIDARRQGAPRLSRAGVPRRLTEVVARGLSFEASDRHPSMQHVVDALQGVRRPKARLSAWATGLAATIGISWAIVDRQPDEDRCAAIISSVDAKWRERQRPSFEERWADAPQTRTRVLRRLDTFMRQWSAEWTNSCELPPPRAEARQRCLKSLLGEFEVGLGVLLEPATSEANAMDVALGSAPNAMRCGTSGSSASAQFASILVDGWNARMMSLYRADRFDDVIAYFERHEEAIELLGTPRQRAQAATTVGRCETFAVDKDTGTKRLEHAHEIATAAGADDLAADISTTIISIASSMDPEWAKRWFDRARVDVERSPDPKVAAHFHAALGWYRIRQGYEQTASAEADAAQDVIDAHGPMPHLEWNIEALRGQIALVARDYEPCLEHYSAALDQLGKWYGQLSVPTISPRAGLLQCLVKAEEFEMAALMLDEQEEVLDRAGFDHGPKRDSLLLLRASLYAATGDDARAIEAFEDLTSRISESHASWTNAWNRLGLARSRQGDHLGARAVFERLRVHQEEKYGPDSIKLAITLHNLAEAESGLADYDAAAEHYLEAIAITEQHEDPGPLRAYALNGLGEVALARGELELARTRIEEAIAIPHDDESERAEAKASLARTLWRIGDAKSRARAVRLADEAAAVFEATPGYHEHAAELRRWRETL